MTKGRMVWQAAGVRQGIPFVVALLLVALAAAPAFAQRGRGRLQGQVTDPEGNPIAGAEVDKLRETGEAGELNQLFTRKFGRQRCCRQLIHVHCTV